MLPDPIPTVHGLATARLRFRRLTSADIQPWRAFFESAVAMRYLLHAVGDQEACQAMIERQLQRYETNGGGLHAVLGKTNAELLGMCGLLEQTVNDVVELEIGYHFLPAHWGHGYATEAAIACREFAFAQTSLPSIVSLIHPDNQPSQQVAIRNGMQRDGQGQFHGIDVDIWRIHRPS